MRRAARSNPSRSQSARSYSIPAPVGGLNLRDAVADMPETDAIFLDDLFPTETGVELARGNTSFATFTGIARTVIPYNGEELFVAIETTNNAIVDATAGGAISTPVVGGSGPTVQAVTSTFFDYAMLGNTSGQFISLVNGADTPLQYNGTTWSASSISGTGLTASDLHTVIEYAERLFFGGDGFDVWYLDVKLITGTATRLNVGSLFTLGGRLNNIMTMSADSSSQLADFIAFVSTEGEIVVFTGTDPSDASLWSRVAHIKVGRPVIRGNRCWCKFGADALLITESGLLSLRNALTSRADDPKVYLSDKIKKGFNYYASTYQADFSLDSSDTWQVIYHPPSQKVIVNTGENPNALASRQYVMNSQTGAWSKFNQQIFSMSTLGKTLYGSTRESGVLNTMDVDGTAVDWGAAVQAYSYFKRRGNAKYMSMMRPIVKVTDIDTIEIGTAEDYEVQGNAKTGEFELPNVTPHYKSTIQDPPTGTTNEWRGVSGVGNAIAALLEITPNNSTASALWTATDFLYEEGPPL